MPRRDRNEPAAFWNGWDPRPGETRTRQLDLFTVPVEDVPRGAVQVTPSGRFQCSAGHRHLTRSVAETCEAKRAG